MPFTPPWNEERLIRHELVMELVTRYICNNDGANCGKSGGVGKEEHHWAFMQWLLSGAKTGHYVEAPPAQKCMPEFGLIDVIHTLPGSVPQHRHRDTHLPGPCATLTVTAPLTPLSPLNGPLASSPGHTC